jgi:hypothetical protein
MDVRTLNNNCPNANSVWIIITVIYGFFLALSIGLNIYLWLVRRRNIIALKEEIEQNRKEQFRESQTNIFYGGLKSTHM